MTIIRADLMLNFTDKNSKEAIDGIAEVIIIYYII